MRKILTLMLVALFVTFTACSEPQTSGEYADENNHSDVVLDNYQEDSTAGSVSNNDVVIEYYENGNKKRETHYYDGVISHIYDYDNDENKASETMYSSGVLYSKAVFDKSGNLICDISYIDDGLILSETVYEENVYIIRQYHNNNPDDGLSQEDTFYPNGKMTTKMYSPDGKYVCTSEYTPGQKNTYEVYTDREGNLVYEMLKDEESNVIESKSYYRNGLLEMHNTKNFYRTYYDDGIMASETKYFADGASIYSAYDVEGIRYYYAEYNARGELIEEEIGDSSFTYETDQRYEDFDIEFSY